METDLNGRVTANVPHRNFRWRGNKKKEIVAMPEVPNGSPAKVAYHQNKLRKLFGRASDQQFLQLMWAIDALRAGRPEAAARLLNFPSQATDQSMGSRFALHQWELETLLIQLFLAHGDGIKDSTSTTTFDCSRFESVATLVNSLRQLENAESAVYLRSDEFNIFG